jgi:hypothetical protein
VTAESRLHETPGQDRQSSTNHLVNSDDRDYLAIQSWKESTAMAARKITYVARRRAGLNTISVLRLATFLVACQLPCAFLCCCRADVVETSCHATLRKNSPHVCRCAIAIDDPRGSHSAPSLSWCRCAPEDHCDGRCSIDFQSTRPSYRPASGRDRIVVLNAGYVTPGVWSHGRIWLTEWPFATARRSFLTAAKRCAILQRFLL